MARPTNEEMAMADLLHSRGVRRCCMCSDIKPVDAFPKLAKNRHGLDRRCKKCILAYNKEHPCGPEAKQRKLDKKKKDRAENPGKYREIDRRYNVRSLYGISVEEYDERMSRPCDICGEHRPPMHLDHCHTTGALRGTLCTRCNPALGAFRDDPALLQAAIDYLRHWSGC